MAQNIGEIVAQARAENQYLLVFLKSKTAPNENLNKIFTSPPVANLLKKLPGLPVCIEQDSIDFQNFTSVYDQTPKDKQALVVVHGGTGVVELYVNEDDSVNIGSFSVQLLKICNQPKAEAQPSSSSRQPEQQSGPISQADAQESSLQSPQKTVEEKTAELNAKLDEKRRQRMKAEADKGREKEKQRRLDGIKMAEAKRRREEEELEEIHRKRREEKLADKLAKDAVKQQLLADKEARRAKAEKEKAEREAAKAPLQAAQAASETCLVMFILPNGSRPRNKFSQSQTMDQIFDFVKEESQLADFKLVHAISLKEIKYSTKPLSEITENKKTFQIKVLAAGQKTFNIGGKV